MIQRTFHPIGQGAFYTEKHENFNIVYDCGNWKKAKLADHVVKQSFKSDEVIDILFISHFDADHVNKIVVLKNHCRAIRNVVLPLLHKQEKLLLVNFLRTTNNQEAANLIDNPNDFFGDETVVILVETAENPEENLPDEINLENLRSPSVSIKSNTQIFSRVSNWIFVPFNYEYNSRNAELQNQFKKHGLDIMLFMDDLNYALKNRTKVKEIYDDVSGQINQNSMMVYSGPRGNHNNITIESFYQCDYRYPAFFSYKYTYPLNRFCCTSNRVGCIYTGDSDLNVVDIRVVFKQYWDNVGTIQIPHHGDIKCFNTSFFDGRSYICPISVGTKNTYGHPSPIVISSILANNSLAVEVTEQLNSSLLQIISN